MEHLVRFETGYDGAIRPIITPASSREFKKRRTHRFKRRHLAAQLIRTREGERFYVSARPASV